jgi:hypothetical protein
LSVGALRLNRDAPVDIKEPVFVMFTVKTMKKVSTEVKGVCS